MSETEPSAYAHENAYRTLVGLNSRGSIPDKLRASMNGLARMGVGLLPRQDQVLGKLIERINQLGTLTDEQCHDLEQEIRAFCDDVMGHR